MKYTGTSIKLIKLHPYMRMDAGFWIKFMEKAELAGVSSDDLPKMKEIILAVEAEEKGEKNGKRN